MVAQGGAMVTDSELQVRAVTDALLAAAQAKEYRSMATNTGGGEVEPKKGGEEEGSERRTDSG